MGIELLAGLGVLCGAALQSATGFGFALMAAPLVVAATTPERAVGLLTVLGLVVNLLTLGTEGRRPRPLWREAARVLAWAAPAAVAGVLVLRSIDRTTLQLAVTVTVLLALVARVWASRAGPRPPHAWHAPVAGLISGALTTTTGTSGPPLVLLLTGRGEAPLRIRDTLTTIFLGLGVVALLVLAASGTTGATPRPAAVAVLIPVTIGGHLVGRRAFARLRAAAYEAVLLAVLGVSVLTGLAVTLL
jgi:uncharacterized protein